MFTPKALRPLAPLAVFVATAIAASNFSGCDNKSLDSPEYGEIIQTVPPELNRPFPLPELDPPKDAPLPGPKKEEANSGEKPE